MATRATMDDLIARIRGMTNAGTAAYEVAGVNFFTDDHIQDVLDRNRHNFRFQPMVGYPQYVGGGTVEYYDHEVGYSDLEKTDGGTATFWVEDGLGVNQGTANWSADYQRGLVTFAANTNGTTYYATGRTYDVNGAAADVLEQWASAETLAFDVGTAERNLARSQKNAMLQRQAQKYRARAWITHTPIVRSDLKAGGKP